MKIVDHEGLKTFLNGLDVLIIKPIKAMIESLRTSIGQLSQLETPSKTSIVSAINDAYNKGAGIASITAEESAISSGENVVTIATTNGKTTSFVIRNGAKGEPGKKGDQGEPGEKGDQGNSGYSGNIDELEIVNNLTQGGETAALSAEMGKELNEKIEAGNYDIVYERDWESMTAVEQIAYIKEHPNLVILEGRDPSKVGEAYFDEGVLTIDDATFGNGVLTLGPSATFENGILTL